MNKDTVRTSLEASHRRLDGLTAQLNFLSNDIIDIYERDMKDSSDTGNTLTVIACRRLFNDAMPMLQEIAVDLANVAKNIDLAEMIALKLIDRQGGTPVKKQKTIHGQDPLTFIRETAEAIQTIDESRTHVYVGRLGNAHELSPLGLAQKYIGEILTAVDILESNQDDTNSGEQ
ncbi:hypothetical protein [Lacticaseibacillus rhamnosus]|uniref:hypothetical protein n=1 Tax=Lacticaseibacillus rhamnosus TaxID=47715 RepID=UPI00237F77C3|nr:hypothetical protein [Lacticaseibacillus rhamnosus]MDE3295712.1 hypothetical protein [Lacticaseibacillus rhamnosus]